MARHKRGRGKGPLSSNSFQLSEQPKAWRSIAYCLIVSFAPVALPAILLAILLCYQGSGASFIDVYHWPSAVSAVSLDCNYDSSDCEAMSRFALQLKILMFICAALPLVNNLSYLREILKAAEEAKGEDPSAKKARGLRKLAQFIALLALVGNAIWLAIIYYDHESKPNAHLDEWAVLILFSSFAVVDSLLAWSYKVRSLHAADAYQYDFFFGNVCFIDIPVATGVYLVIWLSNSVAAGDGALAASTLRAVVAGAAVMHLAASQVVYCFLALQLRLKRLGG